jgi:hypothetical protein
LNDTKERANGAPGAAANNRVNHMAAAAITIVIQVPGGNLEAYTQVISDPGGLPALNGPALSIPAINGGGNPDTPRCARITALGNSMYYTNAKTPNGTNVAAHLLTTITTAVAAGGIGIPAAALGGAGGVPAPNYACCEGQIVARLFDRASPIAAGGGAAAAPLFPQIIANLIAQANAIPRPVPLAQPLGNENIVLVILHIHSHYDPCAKCSKVLSGLSKLMNSPAVTLPGGLVAIHASFNPLLAAAAGVPGLKLFDNLGARNARFLIEVSSNEDYTINDVSSCAEFAGTDNNAANPINITLGAAPANVAHIPLAIPNGFTGVGANWIFENTCPPYVVYGRVAPTTPDIAVDSARTNPQFLGDVL